MRNKKQKQPIPRKPANSKRSRRFNCVLTPVEDAKFRRIAAELGITRSDVLMRWLAQA
jgi:hypothetical protein